MWFRRLERGHSSRNWKQLREFCAIPEGKEKAYLSELDDEVAVKRLQLSKRLVSKKAQIPEFVSHAILALQMGRNMRTKLKLLSQYYGELWLGVPEEDTRRLNSMLSIGWGHRFRNTVKEDIEAIHAAEFLRGMSEGYREYTNKYGSSSGVFAHTPEIETLSDWPAATLPPSTEEGSAQIREWLRMSGFSKSFAKRVFKIFDQTPNNRTESPLDQFIFITSGVEDFSKLLGYRNAMYIPAESDLTYYRSWVIPKDTPGKYRLIQTPNKRLKEIQRNIHYRLSRVDNHRDVLIAYHQGADYVKLMKNNREAYRGLVTLDLKDWYHQINTGRIGDAVAEYCLNPEVKRKPPKGTLSTAFQRGPTSMDAWIEQLQLHITDAVLMFDKFNLRGVGKQVVRTLLYDLFKTVLPQIVLLRRFRDNYPAPDHRVWGNILDTFTIQASLREMFIEIPNLMFLPLSNKRLDSLRHSEKLLMGKVINALGTLVPYKATSGLSERKFDAQLVKNALRRRSDLPEQVIERLTGEVTLEDIQSVTGMSFAANRLTAQDLQIDDGPNVFALAQGSPSSGCLANFYLASGPLNSLIYRLERLKGTVISGYRLLLYSDNVGIFFTPLPGMKYEVAARRVIKDARDVFSRAGIFVNDYKINDYEGDNKKFLGLLVDDDGNVRVSREYLRRVNQIILNLNKEEQITYKGAAYSREEFSVINGMIQWIKRTRGKSPYARRLKPCKWFKRRKAA